MRELRIVKKTQIASIEQYLPKLIKQLWPKALELTTGTFLASLERLKGAAGFKEQHKVRLSSVG